MSADVEIVHAELREDTTLALAEWWGNTALGFIKKGMPKNAGMAANNAYHFAKKVQQQRGEHGSC